MILPLAAASVLTCGGKAGALGALLRAGLPVPDGFVVTFDVYRAMVGRLNLGLPVDEAGRYEAWRQAIETCQLDTGLLEALNRELDALGDPPVAVRSSARDEDTARASAAGQHDSILAVRGIRAVTDAMRVCWASLYSERAIVNRDAIGETDPVMAVIVQRHVDAEVSGVMFTPAVGDGATRIEASWGLGPSVVGGTVTPDTYLVGPDGTVVRRLADKRTRLDRHGTRLVTHDVAGSVRTRPAIDDPTAVRIARLGQQVAAVLDAAQDVEWAMADQIIWLLQARPVTAAPPPAPSDAATASIAALTGTPGSRGIATGTARIVRGPADFGRVRPGDILVCPYTDPAWTSLLRVAAGVVTETGGVLSHAAIVARERRIPAVLGLVHATTRLPDGAVITIDGAAGTVTTTRA